MNLILSNLAALKAAVLPSNLAARTDWDTQIANIGKGVAAAFEQHCNRKFERIEDDTFERPANCSYISLPRFPVEAVSAIELKYDEVGGWVAQPVNSILTINGAVGLVEFGGCNIGTWDGRVRVTYTGGFWAEYLEPDDDDYPTALPDPDTTTPVPADLLHAWHLQVQRVIEATDLLDGSAGAVDESKAAPESGALTEAVKSILRGYVRYA